MRRRWETARVQQPGRGRYLGYATRMGATAGYGFWAGPSIDRIVVCSLEIAKSAPLRGAARKTIDRIGFFSTCSYFLFRETQRNPVTPNSARFRISGHRVPVFSTERPKQPQSMLKPRTMALSNAPENMMSNVASQMSAPLSHRPTKRQIPIHSSKAGRKTARTALAGQGVS
jgi:hypothetical protein